MATIGNTNPTLSDLARRLDTNDKIDTIIELLHDTNEILDDMTWMEGNLLTGHKTTVRTGLPSVAWRKLNYGVAESKSQTKQVVDSCGMLEGFMKVDKDLADLNGNAAEFRMSEARAFFEAMNQELVSTLFYGDTDTDPEKFLGLSARYSVPSATEDNSGYNMIDGGAVDGQTDTTSVWLIVWGPESIHGIVPKGSMAGLQFEDLGVETVDDSAGNPYRAYRSHFQWKAGLTLRDWRQVVRIVNIDTSLLTKDAASGFDLINNMIVASSLVENLNLGRAAFYCSRKVKTFLRLQVRNDSNVNLTVDNVEGKEVLRFDGIPVRRCDGILNTETAIPDSAGTFASHAV